MIPNQPKTVLVTGSQEEYHLRVTALQSNHCPGSLMFIMERLDTNGAVHKRILYTGDFRFDNPDLPLTCLRSLHSGTTPLHIDEMYLDTTFCSNKYLTFPTRQEAEEKIWSICERWIRKNTIFKENFRQHVVLFHLPARYGYEKILQHIYQRSAQDWRVHVPRTKFSEYLCNSSLADCTDPDPNIARLVHACTSNFQKKSGKYFPNKLPCQSGVVSVCHIKPSAMFFTQSKMAALEGAGQDSMVEISQGGNTYRVCYSTHSSMEELEMFVKHFAPAKIILCAIPQGSTKEVKPLLCKRFLPVK